MCMPGLWLWFGKEAALFISQMKLRKKKDVVDVSKQDKKKKVLCWFKCCTCYTVAASSYWDRIVKVFEHIVLVIFGWQPQTIRIAWKSGAGPFWLQPYQKIGDFKPWNSIMVSHGVHRVFGFIFIGNLWIVISTNQDVVSKDCLTTLTCRSFGVSWDGWEGRETKAREEKIREILIVWFYEKKFAMYQDDSWLFSH